MKPSVKSKNQDIKTLNYQESLLKKYSELFRFVERTGEEIFVFPKKYKVGISLKPIGDLRKEFELKDALGKIERGKKEYLAGESEEFETFLKRKHLRYVKTFSKNS